MSFKNKIAAILIAAAAAVSVSGCTEVQGGDPLMWLTFPLSFDGTLTANSTEYEISLTFDTPEHGILTVNAHDYLCDNGTVTLSADGLMLPISVTPPPVSFVTGILSLEAAQLTSTVSDGERVTAVYTAEANEYTVTTDKTGSPLSVSCGDMILKINSKG